MSRACGFTLTTSGEPCANTVADHEDHCAAQHPCPPVRQLASVGAGPGSLVAGAAFDFEDLAYEAPLEIEGKEAAAALGMVHEGRTTRFDDMAAGDAFMRGDVLMTVTGVPKRHALDERDPNGEIWVLTYRRHDTGYEGPLMARSDEVLVRVKPTPAKRVEQHTWHADRHIKDAEEFSVDHDGTQGAAYHYGQAALHLAAASRAAHDATDLSNADRRALSVRALSVRASEAKERAALHSAKLIRTWSRGAQEALLDAGAAAPTNDDPVDHRYDAGVTDLAGMSGRMIPRYRGEAAFLAVSGKVTLPEPDAARALHDAREAVMLRDTAWLAEPLHGSTGNSIFENPHDAIDGFVRRRRDQGDTYRRGIHEAHVMLTEAGIHARDSRQDTWE
jgi:hypothetical protein